MWRNIEACVTKPFRKVRNSKKADDPPTVSAAQQEFARIRLMLMVKGRHGGIGAGDQLGHLNSRPLLLIGPSLAYGSGNTTR